MRSPTATGASSTQDYIVAFADAAAHGGRWIIELDDALAAGIAAKKSEAMATWSQIAGASAFFGPQQNPLDDQAVIGVLASFVGPKAGFSDEVINNLARTKQQYRAIAAGRFTPSSLAQDLKAFIYTDSERTAPTFARPVLDFVNTGGILDPPDPPGGRCPGACLAATRPDSRSSKIGNGAVRIAASDRAPIRTSPRTMP